jgi:hypothetical protein
MNDDLEIEYWLLEHKGDLNAPELANFPLEQVKDIRNDLLFGEHMEERTNRYGPNEAGEYNVVTLMYLTKSGRARHSVLRKKMRDSGRLQGPV